MLAAKLTDDDLEARAGLTGPQRSLLGTLLNHLGKLFDPAHDLLRDPQDLSALLIKESLWYAAALLAIAADAGADSEAAAIQRITTALSLSAVTATPVPCSGPRP